MISYPHCSRDTLCIYDLVVSTLYCTELWSKRNILMRKPKAARHGTITCTIVIDVIIHLILACHDDDAVDVES